VIDVLKLSLQHIGHNSTSFHKATRLIAGPVITAFAISAFLWSISCRYLLPISSLPFSYFFSLISYERSSVEMAGFEPATFALQRRCSPAELHPQAFRLWA
jgi:hypothetical protein